MGSRSAVFAGFFLISVPLCAKAADYRIEKTQSQSSGGSDSGDTGFQATAGANADATGVFSEITALLFGSQRGIASAASHSTNLLEGESELTIAGMRVWSGKGEFKNGAYVYAFSVPTTQLRVPLASIPVGPLMIDLDAGLSFDAALEGALTPQLVIPIEFAALKASLASRVDVAGFVEGYAHFLFLRGGVGGQVDLVRGKAGVEATLSMQSQTVAYSGFFEFLSGKVYAFADYFRLWTGRWKRFLNPVLFRWKSQCVEMNPNHRDPESTCGS